MIYKLLSRAKNDYFVSFILVALLAMSFASYDMVILFAGKATSLMNIKVQDGFRFDEAYMYMAGVGKTILFDPFLKEHAADLTLRPTIPTAIFAAIYWICGGNLDLTIFITHAAVPLLSCYLIYLIGLELTGNKQLAVLAMLLAVGHFAFSAVTFTGQLFREPTGGIAGPDLWLLKEISGATHGMLANITAPNQFTRLFSPGLTLPFLLFPLWLQIRESSPAIRGAAIAANLYVYPHHVIILGVIELAFWIKNKKPAHWSFFATGILAAIPYIVQQVIVMTAGTYADIYNRVGQTSGMSTMWFFVPYFAGISYLLAKRKSDPVALVFSLGCLCSVILIWAADYFGKFPQVHLVGLRILAFLAPLALITTLRKHRLIPYFNAYLLTLILISSIYAGWIHRNEYSNFDDKWFTTDLARLPAGAVVMTDAQKEVAYVSVKSDKYSYAAYGIVSSASNAELLTRFAVIAKVYDWTDDRLHGSDWDGMPSITHWIFHHGAPPRAVTDAEISRATRAIAAMDKCRALQIYAVDYIRFNGTPPHGLETCTQQVSNSFLKVIRQ